MIGRSRRALLAALGGVAGLPALARASTPADPKSHPAAHLGLRLPALGEPVALPPARLVGGGELPPSHWEGKVAVVELWATWCPFCKKQNPWLDRLHRQHKAAGLEVLGMSLDRTAEAVQRYMQEHGYAFHAALYDRPWQQAFGIPKAVPIVFVVGRDGKLKQVEAREMFEEDVDRLARWLDA